MNRTYRIVVGVNGSEGSTRALEWAVTEAANRGGSVQAVMAYDKHPHPAAVPAVVADQAATAEA
jgi:nucleotide-binding universal stress UspA family protein